MMKAAFRLVLFTIGWLVMVGCQAPQEAAPDVITTDSGLQYAVLEEGTGPVAQAGDTVLIHETTQLADGTVVTDTWALNHPIRFLLGGNQVIDGLDEAVTGMRVGERRTLVVPPHLSERTSYPDTFSPTDTLYYNVILLQVTSPQ